MVSYGKTHKKTSNQTEEAPGHGKPRIEIVLLLDPPVSKEIVHWKMKTLALFSQLNVVQNEVFLTWISKGEI